MARLIWDEPSERPYHSGVDRGVFYPIGGPGVVWNGLLSVEETIEFSDSTTYAEAIKYSASRRPYAYTATIKAYTYPDEFESYSETRGLVFGNQNSKRFNFCYRTFEVESEVLHLIYNAIATPSSATHSSEEDDITDFTWTINTRPIKTDRSAPSAHFIIKMDELDELAQQYLLETIYGTDEVNAFMPSIVDIIEILENAFTLRIIDHGDGTWTAIGPDDAIRMLDDTTFEITYPSAIFLDADTYQISSQ